MILELAQVDEKGEQFRYDRNRKGRIRELPDELKRVDLRNLTDMFGKLLANLFGAIDSIDAMIQAAD